MGWFPGCSETHVEEANTLLTLNQGFIKQGNHERLRAERPWDHANGWKKKSFLTAGIADLLEEEVAHDLEPREERQIRTQKRRTALVSNPRSSIVA